MYSRTLFLFCFAAILFQACTKERAQAYKYHEEKYWTKLLAFTEDAPKQSKEPIAWLQISFSTLNDSLFYDSQNDLKDRFYLNTQGAPTLLRNIITSFTEGDSLCALVPPEPFFKQQFNSSVPFFCAGDSAIKIHCRIKSLMSEPEYAVVCKSSGNSESKEIQNFFGSERKAIEAQDPLGFYWVEKPEIIADSISHAGQTLTLQYEGGFLNGRIIDVSPKAFQFIYGTPDQILKGLNYVIRKLKKGQSAKIILPSQLAYGESGSSNGSVPPFTPMLYKITITE